MAFKINIGDKGKTYHLESDSESLHGLKLGEKIQGKDINSDLAGYELEITGMTDKAGFPSKKEIEGLGLKKLLLSYGPNQHKSRPKGIRLRKSIRGNTISKDIVQINLLVKKHGEKKLHEIFPEQNKPKEKVEAKVEEKAAA
jgi:small subunit ribosomal protein S6e